MSYSDQAMKMPPMKRSSKRDILLIFSLAFLMRVIAVTVTSISRINPYSLGDANGFADSANHIAATLLNGTLPILSTTDIYDVWGAMLSPFWLLPGPSRVYARLGIALLGAIGVYNVYVIARHYHSRQSGILAVLPMILYPSFLFMHSTVLREAMVLFGLSTTARLLLVDTKRLSLLTKYASVEVVLALAIVIRTDNLPVYLLVLAVAAILASRLWVKYPVTFRSATVTGALVAPLLSIMYSRLILMKLADMRQRRARGRTEYLGWVFPDTFVEALAFSWIGAVYFLFTPFPWMVSTVADLTVAIEAIGNLVYALFAVYGARVLATKTLPGAGTLVVGIVVGSVLYGLGTANVGTAVRHRQMVLWAIFLLGGIGMAHLIDIRWGDSSA